MKNKTMIRSAKHLLAAAAIICSNTSLAAVELLDQIVAVVDNDVIMSSELDQRTRMIVTQLQSNNTQMPPEDVLRSQILEQLISESLQLQLGNRYGIRVTDEDIDNALARMQQANNFSAAEFEAKLAADGIDAQTLREQIRRDMIIDQVQKGSVNRRITISPREIESFLKSKQGQFWSSPDYNLGHILIAVPSSASNDEIKAAERKARDIHYQLAEGADFRQLAVAESQGQNALKGGDLGWRKSAQLPELFADSVAGLEPGQVSEPLRSGAGFHILKLYGKRGDQEQVIDQAKVRHILIKPSAILSDQEAKQKLSDIRTQILAGKPFEEMAKEYSEDTGSMLSGGDLGWSLPGKFVPEFERAISETASGKISPPFRSQFGWHILQVQERRQQDMSDTVRTNRAASLLRNRRFDEERINWLQEIRGEAYVEIK